MAVALVSLAVLTLLLAGGAWALKRRLDAMPSKEKKQILKRRLNGVFIYCEQRGWIRRTPAFMRDYLRDFPALAKLEAGFPAIREEYGSGMCNITRCCTEVCPEHIGITDNGIIPLKERVVDRYYDPLLRIGRALFGKKKQAAE